MAPRPLAALFLLASSAFAQTHVEVVSPEVGNVRGAANVTPLEVSAPLQLQLQAVAPAAPLAQTPSVTVVPSALETVSPSASKALLPTFVRPSIVAGKAAVPATAMTPSALKPVLPAASKRGAPETLVQSLSHPALDVGKLTAGDSAGAAEKDFMARAQLGETSALASGSLGAASVEALGVDEGSKTVPRLKKPTVRGPKTASALDLAHAPVPLPELTKALLAEPKLLAAIEGAMADLPYPPQTAAELLEVLGPALEPSLRARAAELGFPSPEKYAGFVLSEKGARERAELASRLSLLPMHSGEMYSGFFRSRHAWSAASQDYLDRTVAAKAKSGDRTLVAKSLGMGSGQEPYSIAIQVEAALRKAKEDPAKWKVVIEAYDINARSLWAVTRGSFQHDEIFGGEGQFGGGLPDGYAALAKELFPKTEAGRYEALPRLRSWMKPVWLNLNDVPQQAAFEETPGDVAFANNTMIHMKHGPSVALSDKLLTGSWARKDGPSFLNFNGMAVMEIDPPGAKSNGSSLESSDGARILAGATSGGNVYRTITALGEKMVVGLGQRPTSEKALGWLMPALQSLRWLRGGLLVAPAAIRAARAFAAKLSSHPTAEAALSRPLVDLASGWASSRGLSLRVHFDAAPMRLEDGAVSVNAGLLMAEAGSEKRRAAFLGGLFESLLGGKPEGTVPSVEVFSDPDHGDGLVLAKGATSWGATVRAVRSADGVRLVWLAGGRYRPTYGLARP